jgi:UDP-N-acetylglucosamine 1-carboxyvinyltransferase
MKIIEIEGGRPMEGDINISGSKNSSLPILSCALMLDEKTTIQNVPKISDVKILRNIIEGTGAKCTWENNGSFTIDPSSMHNCEVGMEANLSLIHI